MSFFKKLYIYIIIIYLPIACCAIQNTPARKSCVTKVSESEMIENKFLKYMPDVKAQCAARRLYEKNPKLAGIIFFGPDGDPQVGENTYTLEYVFWDGKSHQVVFNSDGRIISEAKAENPTYEGFWDLVDFSYGSDPEFVLHKDPRIGQGE